MNQKILTIVVPAYNVEKYIRRCLGSLVTGGDDIEILVVNDGSTDNTANIAQEYVNLYPEIVKIINKVNGGHGSTINTGLKIASGEYFYVVDADDWLEVGALERVLKTMKKARAEGLDVDLFIVNYVYDQFDENKRFTIRYTSVFPQEKVFGWQEAGAFKMVQFVLLHSTIHKTSILRDSGVVLPEHTFYVDNILVYTPMPLFPKLFYIDVDLYKYYIGRVDQSVSYQSMVNRVDQYVRVAKIMITSHHLEDIKNRKLRRYMYSYLAAILTMVNAFLTISGTRENALKKRELRKFLKDYDRRMYWHLMKNPLYFGSHIEGEIGKLILLKSYHIGRKLFKFS